MNFGVTDAIRAAGMVPGTSRSAVLTESATRDQASALDIEEGEPVNVLDRVRTADGIPVVNSRDIVAATLLSTAELTSMPLDGSLYELLERRGHPVAHGVVTIEPERAGRMLARLLSVKTGELLLFLSQVDYGSDGEPLLLSEERHLAEVFEFTVVRKGPGRSAR